MAVAGKDRGSRRRPVVEDDALVFRVPERPPADGTVTVDHKEGKFVYAPPPEGDAPDPPRDSRAGRASRTSRPG